MASRPASSQRRAAPLACTRRMNSPHTEGTSGTWGSSHGAKVGRCRWSKGCSHRLCSARGLRGRPSARRCRARACRGPRPSRPPGDSRREFARARYRSPREPSRACSGFLRRSRAAHATPLSGPDARPTPPPKTPHRSSCRTSTLRAGGVRHRRPRTRTPTPSAIRPSSRRKERSYRLRCTLSRMG